MNNEIVHTHLCEECVERRNDHDAANGFDDKLHSLLEGLIRSKSGENGPSADIKCESCGTTLREYRKVHLLGCPGCYDLFAKYFSKDSEGTKVLFSKATRSEGMANHLNFLKNELKNAVETEDFERAAELRDKILHYEKRGVFGDN